MPTFPPTAGIPPRPGVGRNTFRGPRYRGFDMTLAKAFGMPKMKVLGRTWPKLNLQANIYNVFNMLNLTDANHIDQQRRQ